MLPGPTAPCGHGSKKLLVVPLAGLYRVTMSIQLFGSLANILRFWAKDVLEFGIEISSLPVLTQSATSKGVLPFRGLLCIGGDAKKR